MEKQEKLFLKRMGKNIARDDASVPEKKIKVYFQQFLQDLPNGDLKAALLKNKEKSFAFLVRCVKRVSKKQKQETASALSNGHSSSDGVQPERQSEDEVSAVDDATAKAKPASSSLLHSQDVARLQIVQLLKSDKDVVEMGTQIDSLWEKTGAGDADKHCKLLMMMGGSADLRFVKNVMNLYFNAKKDESDEIIEKKSKKRARAKLDPMVKFLKMCHLRRSVLKEEETSFPCYADLVTALLSVYLDLFVIAHRGEEMPAKEQRRMGSLVKQLTVGMGEKSLDTVLQTSVSDLECSADIAPLIRYFLREKPGKKNHSHYLRYILTVRTWQKLLSDDDIMGARQIPAPKYFVEWVSDVQPSLKELMPNDKKFRGRTVTAFLVDDADEEVLTALNDALVTYEKEASAGNVSADKWKMSADPSKKKPQKKPQKTLTTTEEEEQEQGAEEDEVEPISTVDRKNADDSPASHTEGADEVQPLFTIDRGNTGSKAAANPDVQELSTEEVEVFDLTGLGQDEDADFKDKTDKTDLFVIDRGTKRPSFPTTPGEEPKKKKKKKTKELKTTDHETSIGDSRADDAAEGLFFIDTGNKRSPEKQSASLEKETGSKRMNKKKNKSKADEHETEMIADVTSPDTVPEMQIGSPATVLPTSGEEADVKRAAKKKRKSKGGDDTQAEVTSAETGQEGELCSAVKSPSALSDKEADSKQVSKKKRKSRDGNDAKITEITAAETVPEPVVSSVRKMPVGSPVKEADSKKANKNKRKSKGGGNDTEMSEMRSSETVAEHKVSCGVNSPKLISDQDDQPVGSTPLFTIDRGSNKLEKRKSLTTKPEKSSVKKRNRSQEKLPPDQSSAVEDMTQESTVTSPDQGKQGKKVSSSATPKSPKKTATESPRAGRRGNLKFEEKENLTTDISSAEAGASSIIAPMAESSTAEYVPDSETEDAGDKNSLSSSTVVPNSFSEGDSQGEAFIPDLSVHMKTKPSANTVEDTPPAPVDSCAKGVKKGTLRKESLSELSVGPEGDSGRRRRKSSASSVEIEIQLKSSVEKLASEKPHARAEKRKSLVSSLPLDTETEGFDAKVEKTVRSGTPQNATKQQPKTPKRTTPVSRRTRSQRLSALPQTPTSSKPSEDSEQVTSKTEKESPKKTADDPDVKKGSQSSLKTDENKDLAAGSQTDSDSVTARKAQEGKEAKSSLKPGSSPSAVQPLSTRTRRTSLPGEASASMVPEVKKKTMRRSVRVDMKTAVPSSPLTRNQIKTVTEFTSLKSLPAKTAGRTRMKPLPESPIPSPISDKVSPAKRPKRGAVNSLDKQKEGDSSSSSPDKTSSQKSGQTSAQKSASAQEQTTEGHEIETRSRTRTRGYNLRQSKTTTQ